MQLSNLFSPALSLTQVEGRSKKRLFEIVSQKIAAEISSLSYEQIFDALIARERLGSTGLGEGVAIPHCRLNTAGLSAIGALIQLSSPIDFDAPDQQPVDLLAFLVVAGEATQDHLDALAAITEKLSDQHTRSSLRAAASPDDLFATLIGDQQSQPV